MDRTSRFPWTSLRVFLNAGVAGWAAAVCCTAAAVDVPNRNSPPEHRTMREARALVAQQRWAQAEQLLATHVRQEPRDADAHNLLGFSLRNLGRLQASLVAYRRALELDPDHLGAHEYIGEAYVQLGDMARARTHLAALERLCPAGCPELEDLRASLQAAGARTPPTQPPASAPSRPR
jgi:cytochrome c-type biogenesis protein CcmH/NrfG